MGWGIFMSKIIVFFIFFFPSFVVAEEKLGVSGSRYDLDDRLLLEKSIVCEADERLARIAMKYRQKGVSYDKSLEMIYRSSDKPEIREKMKLLFNDAYEVSVAATDIEKKSKIDSFTYEAKRRCQDRYDNKSNSFK